MRNIFLFVLINIIMLIQTNPTLVQFITINQIKINVIFIFCVFIVYLKPFLLSFFIIVYIGLINDIYSSSYLGFYALIFSFSITPIFFLKNFLISIQFPSFLIITIFSTALKMVIETFLITIIMDLESAINYLAEKSLLESIYSIAISPLFYLIYRFSPLSKQKI